MPPPSSLPPWPGSGSVLQNTGTYHQTTERHIQGDCRLNIYWSNNLKCDWVTDTCFWYSKYQPSFISGENMQDTGSTHTLWETLMWLKKNNEPVTTRICGSIWKYADLIPASAMCSLMLIHYWAHEFKFHAGWGRILIFRPLINTEESDNAKQDL